MSTGDHDPRVERAKNLSKGLGAGAGILLLLSGAVPLPPFVPDVAGLADAGREALRWGRTTIGLGVAALLALAWWDRRRRAAAEDGERPVDRVDA